MKQPYQSPDTTGHELARMLFGWSQEEANALPLDCSPTRHGYPWKRLIQTYGLETLNAAFKASNWNGCEEAYHAETRFLAWFRRNYGWTPARITTDW